MTYFVSSGTVNLSLIKQLYSICSFQTYNLCHKKVGIPYCLSACVCLADRVSNSLHVLFIAYLNRYFMIIIS